MHIIYKKWRGLQMIEISLLKETAFMHPSVLRSQSVWCNGSRIVECTRVSAIHLVL